jgi:hypothetical protein
VGVHVGESAVHWSLLCVKLEYFFFFFSGA